MKKKLEITYITFRGMGGHENLQWDKHWVEYEERSRTSFDEACHALLRSTGFLVGETLIPPTAIIALRRAAARPVADSAPVVEPKPKGGGL